MAQDDGKADDSDIARRAVELHARYGGKIQMLPKCPVRGRDDFAVWYTPGVAAASRAIADDPAAVWRLTNKANTVAVVSDGTRVLGLGDIGPEAAMPVMEGNALLFKYLGGVDAVPVCVDASDADDLVRTVLALQPSFGGINLEDIAQPKCFRVLDAVRRRARIPVWHDDQQGTAAVVLAGLINALKVVGKDLKAVRIAMIGIGAANFATYRLVQAVGVSPEQIVACDTQGILHRGRRDLAGDREAFAEKWQVCSETNPEQLSGGIAEALHGADVCIAFTRSGPGIIEPAWVKGMAGDAIVFACANPVPEIWPAEARAAGARIVATGRGDFPNQVNNALAFPGIFRGVLDVRASGISDGMAIAAANELARAAEDGALSDQRILPAMTDWEVAARVAAATGVAAQADGLAPAGEGYDALFARAREAIAQARTATAMLMEQGLIADD